jgi:Ni,Fe-hydrogenase III large subunit
MIAPLVTYNGRAFDREAIPRVDFATFRRAIVGAPARRARVAALFGVAAPEDTVTLFAVIAVDRHGHLELSSTRLESDAFDSMTPECPQVHLFERELAELWSVVPTGHPWLKPVRFQSAWRHPHEVPAVGVTDFYRVEGEEVHEVAVGPVHAGIIEPGHFRFQCHGEQVFHLEISLGYQHRGVERALALGPNKRTIHYVETLAGDTTIGHATAYVGVIEALGEAKVPARAQALRGIALELERLANHTGNLGGLANDIGFLPTASYCGRLRGDFLNMTAAICGNRFGRGLVRLGGVAFDVDKARVDDLLARLDAAARDVEQAVSLLWSTASVQARFEETGRVSQEVAREIGLVGVAARACGLARDVRHDHPCGIYRFSKIPIAVLDTGDVFARAFVRWLEIQRSIKFVRDQLRGLPAGAARGACGPLAPWKGCVSLVEGTRGELCHVALTDGEGRFDAYKVVDASFHNWLGVAMALRGQQISDFPLCNKSFDLSYCGYDL